MLSDSVKLFSMTRKTLLGEDSARRLAMGVAFGVVIGLLPKDSLLVWVVGLVLMITTANLLCALVSGFVFSWVGFFLDPLTHKLGGLVLTADGLEPTWMWLYEIPLMPWTRFNNTVVMGSLILGLVLAAPVYLLSFHFFQNWGVVIHNRLRRTLVYRWLFAPHDQPVLEESA